MLWGAITSSEEHPTIETDVNGGMGYELLDNLWLRIERRCGAIIAERRGHVPYQQLLDRRPRWLLNRILLVIQHMKKHFYVFRLEAT
ncbi:hypothetical protein TNCV_4569011 [Trichonephila clavipes]|nr:hypothetical protein TNCV_4569011 [Trichonephila clavipes]